VKALLLAAGHGSRLRPITLTEPKCLVAIGGKPLLEHWLDSLWRTRKFERVIINTHHLAEKVEAFVSQSAYSSWIELSHEPVLLGSAGTFLAHERALSKGDFLVAHADNLSLIDWSGFLAAFNGRPAEALGTMMTFRTDTPKSCGIVEADPRGLLVAMHEKVDYPVGDIANAAVYMFSPAVFPFIRSSVPQGAVDISTDIIPTMFGRLNTFFNALYHRDIGTEQSLHHARHDVESWQTSTLTAVHV
jgi:mannose-1-phosphate guanylyltransferase